MIQKTTIYSQYVSNLEFDSILQERVTNLREHREFEKEFEVKTALTGERNLERGAAVCPLYLLSPNTHLCFVWHN